MPGMGAGMPGMGAGMPGMSAGMPGMGQEAGLNLIPHLNSIGNMFGTAPPSTGLDADSYNNLGSASVGFSGGLNNMSNNQLQSFPQVGMQQGQLPNLQRGQMNGLPSLDAMSGLSGMNDLNGLNGMGAMNGLNGMGAMNGLSGMGAMNGLNGSQLGTQHNMQSLPQMNQFGGSSTNNKKFILKKDNFFF
jgi:hypothetical protein